MPEVELWWLTVSLNFLISLFVPCLYRSTHFLFQWFLQLSSLTFLNKTETKSNTIVLVLLLIAPPHSMDDFKQSMVCTAQYSKSVRLCTLLVFRCALTRSSGHVLIKRYWRSHRSPARCRQFLCQFSWRCEFGSRCICPQALQKETYREITHPVIQVSVSTFYTSLTYLLY